MFKLSSLTLATVGSVIGCICLVAGVAIQFGFPYALILVGVLIVAGSVLFVDVGKDDEVRK